MFKKIIGVLLLGAILILNLRVCMSLRQQYYIVGEFNNNSYNKPKSFYSNIIVDFPNISETGMPLSTIKAHYYQYDKTYTETTEYTNQLNEAVKLYHKGIKDNKYIGASEAQLADTYYAIGLLDSAKFYSKISYEKLPSNARHLLLYLKKLSIESKIDEIDSVFFSSIKNLPKITADKKYNAAAWTFYLSTIVQYQNSEKKKLYDSIALLAKNKFPNDGEVKLISNYVIYGRDNVDRAIQLTDSAFIYSNNKQYSIAADLLNQSNQLFPKQPFIMQNLGINLYKAKNYLEALDILNLVRENFRSNDGLTENLILSCLLNLERLEEACDFYSIIKKENYNFLKSVKIKCDKN